MHKNQCKVDCVEVSNFFRQRTKGVKDVPNQLIFKVYQSVYSILKVPGSILTSACND